MEDNHEEQLEQLFAEYVDRLNAGEKIDAHYHLARAHALLGRAQEAKREAERALDHEADFVQARVLPWELAGEPGGFEGKEFASIALESEGAPDWRNLWLSAYSGLRKKDWPLAAKAYAALAALEKEPFVGCSLESHLGLGVAQLNTEDFTRAQGSFAVARALAGGSEPALLLAKALYREGKVALVEETLAELREKAGPQGKDASAIWAGAVYDSRRDHKRGLEWARKVKEGPPGDRLEGYFLYRLGKTQEAIAAGSKATLRNPRDPVAHLVLGLALFDDLFARAQDGPAPAGELDRLLAMARSSIELAPESGLARDLLGAATAMHSRNERNPSMKPNVITVMFIASLAAGLAGAGKAQQGYFDDVHPVDEVNTVGNNEGAPYPSSDGLELYFQRHSGVTGLGDIYVATREKKGDPWDPPQPVSEINTPADEGDPCISADGKSLYFYSQRAGGRGLDDIYVATRDARGLPFSKIEPLDEINTPDFEFSPRISANDLTLYFCFNREDDWTDIWVATRPRAYDDLGNRVRFGNAVPLSEINTPYSEFHPAISANELTIFWTDFGGLYPESQATDVYFATRSRVDDGLGNRVLFGPRTRLGLPVNTELHEGICALSLDWPARGSKLYFTRCEGMECPSQHIYEATWYPYIRFVRGDANGDGKADISDAVSILGYLFLSTKAPACLAAANTDDNAGTDISDATYLLNFLFLGGPAPMAPYPDCGPGTLPEDEESCETPPECCYE